MRPNQLITGESILQYSDNELITLTTHRIQYKSKTWGQSNFISIMLEKVSSVQVVGISYPILLVIGILIIIIGAFIANENQGRDEGGVIGIAVGVIFIVAYFITKRHICVIASDGGNKIVFRTEGMNTENVINIMDKIELAKNNRVVRLAAN